MRTLRRLFQVGRKTIRRTLDPIRRLRPRRIDVCCCGLSKTGTHSIAGLFQNYRSMHHPDAQTRLPLAEACLQGSLDDWEAQTILHKRDRVLWLEAESSALAGILIQPLVQACPTKSFILTIRDVYSWCDSWLDHNINSPPKRSSPWAQLDKVRLRVNDFVPTRHDKPLLDHGFPPLACYFQLWQGHNARVLETVPGERLMVVKTQDIIASVPTLAEWLGIPERTLCVEKGWVLEKSKAPDHANPPRL